MYHTEQSQISCNCLMLIRNIISAIFTHKGLRLLTLSLRLDAGLGGTPNGGMIINMR